MRPLHVTLSAFGPFSGIVEVPMEKLGDRGLFLITGPTGAGKTTLFDAIVFALYGEASGDVREPLMLRCKEAVPTADTYVKLRFALGDKHYEITRNPQYEREAKRGGGLTLQKPEAELVFPGGRSVTGMKNVTVEVCTLLGLDRSQFARTAMIAQGDFLKLLLSGTTERSAIFQKLFGTMGYQKLQAEIKSDAAEVKNRHDLLTARMAELAAAVPGGEALTEEALPGHVEALCKEEEIAYNKLEQDNIALQKDIAALTLEMAQAKRRGLLAAQVQDREERLKSLTLRHRDLKKREKSLPFVQARIQTLTAALAALGETLAELKAQEALCVQKRGEYRALDKEWQAAAQAEAAAAQGLEQAHIRLEALKDLELRAERIETGKKACEEQQERLLRVQTVMGEYVKSRSSHHKARAAYTALEVAYTQQNQDCMAQELLFFGSQAGILASQLSPGEPCPVCGGREHPRPAAPVEDAPDQQKILRLRKALEQARQALKEKADLCGQLQMEKAALHREVLVQIEAVLGSLPLEEVRPRLEARLAEIQEELVALHVQAQKMKALTTQREQTAAAVPKLTEAREQARQTLDLLARQRAVTEAQGRDSAEKAARLKAQMGVDSTESGEARQTLMKSQLGRGQAAYSSLQEGIAACDRENAALLAESNTLREQLAVMPPLKDGVQEAFTKAQETQQALVKEKENRFARLSHYRKLLADLQREAAQLTACREKYAWITALSNTAEGRIRGRQRLNFETYVQIGYFEMVIRAANMRFTGMTEGRYRLVRKEPDSLQSQCGLDLDVLDLYSGAARSVKTLSGGESFKASLSLALGLADVVQAYAGGIRMDAMFVDEGFGSLDAESLDLAVRILAELSAAGRLVGIISHVAELKDRIEKKIVVSREGERIRVET